MTMLTVIGFTILILLVATFIPRWLLLLVLRRWNSGVLSLIIANATSLVALCSANAIAANGFDLGIREAVRILLPFQTFWLLKDLLGYGWKKLMNGRRLLPRWVGLSVKGLLVGFLLLFFGSGAVVLVKSQNGLYVQEADMPVPGSNVVIRIERRTAHAFLAEYDRAVVVLDDGKEVGRVPMFVDTGGRVLVRVYQMAPDRIRLLDESDVYDVDLRNGQAAQNSELYASSDGGQLLGSFDETDVPDRQFRFIPITEQPPPRLRYGHMR